jgi:hypothetical protein
MSAPITPENRALIIERVEASLPLAEESLIRMVAMRKEGAPGYSAAFEAVHNAAEFVLLLQFDFHCLLGDFVRHTGSWRGSLYARLLLLVIHESAVSFRSLLAKDFQAQLAVALGRETARDEAKALHKAASKLYERSEASYGVVRDGIVAHRDRNAETRSDLLEMVDDHEAVASLMFDMMDIISELARLTLEYSHAVLDRAAPSP